MVVLMHKLLETKYLYITYRRDLQHIITTCQKLLKGETEEYFAGNSEQTILFNSCKRGEEPIFDLGDVKITSDIAEDIAKYQREGIRFTDNKNPIRGNLLNTNNIRRAVDLETVPLPEFDYRKKTADYIKELSTECVYEIPNNKLGTLLAVVITMVRPKVKLRLQYSSADVLRFVNNNLQRDILMSYTDYWFVTTEGIEEYNTRDKTTQRSNSIDVFDADTQGFLVPKVFGEKQLHKEEGWNRVFQKALRELAELRDQQPKTLGEVLKTS